MLKNALSPLCVAILFASACSKTQPPPTVRGSTFAPTVIIRFGDGHVIGLETDLWPTVASLEKKTPLGKGWRVIDLADAGTSPLPADILAPTQVYNQSDTGWVMVDSQGVVTVTGEFGGCVTLVVLRSGEVRAVKGEHSEKASSVASMERIYRPRRTGSPPADPALPDPEE